MACGRQQLPVGARQASNQATRRTGANRQLRRLLTLHIPARHKGWGRRSCRSGAGMAGRPDGADASPRQQLQRALVLGQGGGAVAKALGAQVIKHVLEDLQRSQGLTHVLYSLQGEEMRQRRGCGGQGRLVIGQAGAQPPPPGWGNLARAPPAPTPHLPAAVHEKLGGRRATRGAPLQRQMVRRREWCGIMSCTTGPGS